MAPVKATETNAVLFAEENSNAVSETLYLLSISGMRESIQAGMNEPVSECSEKLWIDERKTP